MNPDPQQLLRSIASKLAPQELDFLLRYIRESKNAPRIETKTIKGHTYRYLRYNHEDKNKSIYLSKGDSPTITASPLRAFKQIFERYRKNPLPENKELLCNTLILGGIASGVTSCVENRIYTQIFNEFPNAGGLFLQGGEQVFTHIIAEAGINLQARTIPLSATPLNVTELRDEQDQSWYIANPTDAEDIGDFYLEQWQHAPFLYWRWYGNQFRHAYSDQTRKAPKALQLTKTHKVDLTYGPNFIDTQGARAYESIERFLYLIHELTNTKYQPVSKGDLKRLVELANQNPNNWDFLVEGRERVTVPKSQEVWDHFLQMCQAPETKGWLKREPLPFQNLRQGQIALCIDRPKRPAHQALLALTAANLRFYARSSIELQGNPLVIQDPMTFGFLHNTENDLAVARQALVYNVFTTHNANPALSIETKVQFQQIYNYIVRDTKGALDEEAFFAYLQALVGRMEKKDVPLPRPKGDQTLIVSHYHPRVARVTIPPKIKVALSEGAIAENWQHAHRAWAENTKQLPAE